MHAPMLLRSSISNTKKFFQKTIQSFKSFLSGGYERLPKTPPLNPISCSDVDVKFSQNYKELDKFYRDFSDRWDNSGKVNHKAKEERRKKKKLVSPSSNHDEKQQVCSRQKKKKKYDEEEKRDDHDQRKKRNIVYEGKRKAEEDLSCPKGVRSEARRSSSCSVAQKLKELEMMDRSNVEHVLDIEEVLHYYSRLTCPAYLDIVDNFFMDMYAELFSVKASSTHHGNHSRPMLPSPQLVDYSNSFICL